MLPYVSIIIPVYNGEKYINMCLNSLINQTERNLEVICIDDGSTDRSLYTLRNYSEADSRIHVLSQANAGPGPARNFGMANATGEYILFLDIDDYLELNAVEKLYYIAKSKNSDFLFYGFVQEAEDGKILSKYGFEQYSNYSKKNLMKLLTIGKLPFGAFHLIKNSVIKDHNCAFSSTTKQNEELLFKLKVLLYSNTIGFTDYTPYHYIKHPVSLSKLVISNQFEIYENLINEVSIILRGVIEDEREFFQLINTFRFNKLVIWGYSECRSSDRIFLLTYKSVKAVIKAKLKGIDLGSIDLSLLSLKVKVLSMFIFLRAYLAFSLFSYGYKYYDEGRIK